MVLKIVFKAGQSFKFSYLNCNFKNNYFKINTENILKAKMMFKFVIFVWCQFSIAICEPDAATMEMLEEDGRSSCVPNLPADKAKMVADCENILPKTVSIKYSHIFS